MKTGQYLRPLCAVIGVLLITASCGTKGPEPPKPGSPAFLWGVAQDSYKKGDFAKTNDSLERLLGSKNEYAARALPWKVVLAVGVTKGYMDMGEKYDAGSKASRSDPAGFRKQRTVFRNQARTIAMQAAEAVHKFQTTVKEPNVALAFPFPAGSLDESTPLKKVTTGMPLPEAEVDKVTGEMLQRGVVQVVSRAAGFPKELDKAKAAFTAEETQIPREKFLMAIATGLYEMSDLFSSTKMDEPDKLKMLCQEATELLAQTPQSKDRKDLTEKIEKSLKKIRSTR